MHKALEHGAGGRKQVQKINYAYIYIPSRLRRYKKMPKYYLSLYKGAERKGEIAIQYNE